MAAYYNEIDPYAAAWLRNLIAKGLIAPGDVDERSIEDVSPTDLIGYTQCHFFAGIGVWSHALRSVGWPDDRPVWTGSCPCQPFSAAGQGNGFADERHLWPHFHWLIAQCRPARVFGEQVASGYADPWIDLVQTDLEAVGYGVGAVPFPSAGVGAPHIRDRLYWVADAERERGRGGELGRQDAAHARVAGEVVRLADHASSGRREERSDAGRGAFRNRTEGLAAGPVVCGSDLRPGPTNGFWRNADWLGCTDGKWRPVEPGTFPLAHGAPARVGRLRAYGNAINAEAAAAFIVAAEEAQLWL
jgi:DNA (cytosine-5)-methyltransferase 1